MRMATSLPAWYDEAESDVELVFEWTPVQRATAHSAEEGGYVEIHRVVRRDGEDITDQVYDSLQLVRELEAVCEGYLAGLNTYDPRADL